MATATDQGVPNEDQGPVILGATLTVTIAALITMITRLYVRVAIIRNMGWDDYVMISAMVLVCHPTLSCRRLPQSLYFVTMDAYKISYIFDLTGLCKIRYTCARSRHQVSGLDLQRESRIQLL